MHLNFWKQILVSFDSLELGQLFPLYLPFSSHLVNRIFTPSKNTVNPNNKKVTATFLPAQSQSIKRWYKRFKLVVIVGMISSKKVGCFRVDLGFDFVIPRFCSIRSHKKVKSINLCSSSFRFDLITLV